ncbi:SDR family NAD(P)-dependent oxidoreductase [Roseateles sp.]|uniref:SDR family NAD(P)-dependent oxidoreductase n=1 Tax=Roseateles sp. TaxID=1971397 RepID=UPI00286CD98A|nr:SDR family NAD(P)-dependent oxidoreductase [Roseateles sp.]
MNAASAFVQQYGPWALVTGASDGIGRAFAEELARRGVHVILVARRRAQLEQLAARLTQAHGVQCRVVPANLSNTEGVQQVLKCSKDHDVGLVVCAAGFGTSGLFLQNDLPTELDMLQVNCGALAALSWGMGHRLVQRGRGGLLLLSSVVAFQGVPRSAHYAASKAYVQTLAEGLREEWSGLGVQVLAVAPGPVRSGFAARSRMTMAQAEDPQVVARASLDALGRTGTVRPGFLAKLLGYSLALTPRWARIKIMGKVMAGMARRP